MANSVLLYKGGSSVNRSGTVYSVIAALAENRVIGRKGRLPWHLSSDLRRFKRITMGHHIVMGRRTFESIERPLPGRSIIVLTRKADYALPSALVARDLAHAFELAGEDPGVFVIGGGEVFRQALTHVDRMYLTLVHARVEGDTYFPKVDWEEWTQVESQRYPADVRNDHDYSFFTYERRASGRDEGETIRAEA